MNSERGDSQEVDEAVVGEDQVPTPEERQDFRFGEICEDFVEYLESVSDLLDELAPHVEHLDNRARDVETILSSSEHTFSLDDMGEIEAFFDKHLFVEKPKPVGALVGVLYASYQDKSWQPGLVYLLYKQVTYKPKLTILNNSQITMIISGLESVLGELTTHYFRVAPQALEAGREREKEFSLGDLKKLGSIEDAVEAAIASRVDGLLHGSIAGWRKFYKDRLNIDFTDLAIDWSTAEEVFERRHAIIHNGGRATKKYLNVTKRTDIVVDQPLISDADYVRSAIDQLLVLGFSLAISVWRKLAHSKDRPDGILLDVSYKMLVRRRWAAAKQLCSHGLEHASTAENAHLYRVNLWLARRGLGDAQAVFKEVENWDVSALKVDFQLAKACLSEDYDTAFELLPEMVKSDRVSGDDLLRWPLLEGMRADARFSTFAGAIEASLSGADLVYHLPGGKVYHLTSCASRGAGARLVPLEEATESGARPCKTCHGREKDAA